MRILDHTPDVRTLLLASLAKLDRIVPGFQHPRAELSLVLDASARDLVALLKEIYQLRRFARLGAPHIDDLGGFGTGLDDSDAPAVMSTAEGREDWDFQPWLAEKIQSAEQLLFRVCDICAPGAESLAWPTWRRVGRYEDPAAECCRLLKGVRAYLTAILGLLERGELKIRQLSAIEDSDEEDTEA